MKILSILTVCMACACVCAQSPAHDALKKEIAELRKKPTVLALPPYMDGNGDFAAECDKAGAAGKKVLVSIGREACARCERFYELVRTGTVAVNTNSFVFIRLDIDEPAHREYFFGTFEPADNKLPFVGVTDASRNPNSPCLTGAPSPAEYQKLLGKNKSKEGSSK